jgi:uracil-DNA glycosylase family 4
MDAIDDRHPSDSIGRAEALALLAWQIELGADEAILDAAVDRYGLSLDTPSRPGAETSAPPPVSGKADPVAAAQVMAASAPDLETLAARMSAFDQCEIKRGARSFVFSDGDPRARVMIVGEAPGRDEDIAGRPFVGAAGQLLDLMLSAIGLSRGHPSPERGVYITNVLPWRPPSNRTPDGTEIAMFLPFLRRHIELASPDLVVLMGNTPCQALLGRTGITRIRGQWTEALGRPVLPMFHPAYLLRTPEAKREAWADLLSLRARLGQG